MASFGKPKLFTGLLSGADLSAETNLYKAVDLNSAGDVVLAIAGVGIGFLQNTPKLGQFAEVSKPGDESLGISAATLAVGVDLKSDANGDLVEASVAGDLVIAVALAASVDNDKFRLLNVRYYRHA